MTTYTDAEITEEAAETMAANFLYIEEAETALYWAEWRCECAELDIEGEYSPLAWNDFYEAVFNLGVAEEDADETASLFAY